MARSPELDSAAKAKHVAIGPLAQRRQLRKPHGLPVPTTTELGKRHRVFSGPTLDWWFGLVVWGREPLLLVEGTWETPT